MKINTNISSLQAQHSLNRTQKALSRALAHLASGRRVMDAKDDVAALAIGEKLSGQIRSHSQVVRNINDAYGFVQTADSTIGTQIDLVQRMRELAVQSANGSLGSEARANLNIELQQLYAEYNRIASSAEFNGTRLLDGSFGSIQIQAGSEKGQSIDLRMPDSSANSTFTELIGTGSFENRTTFAGLTTGTKTIAADMNDDGDIDLVVKDSGGLGIYYGNGDGSFSSRTTVTTAANTNFAIGDMDGNGYNDVVFFSGANISTALNTNGVFTTTTVTGVAAASGIGIADVNADNKMDIVYSYSNGALGMDVQSLLGVGGGHYTASATFTASGVAGTDILRFGDFDEDGKIDFVFNSGTSTVTIMRGLNDGTFTATGIQNLSTGGSYSIADIAVGDLTGDGHLDVAAVAARLAVAGEIIGFTNNGTGTLTATATTRVGLTTAPGITGMSLGDLNGDGRLDAVVGVRLEDKISVLLANANGSFATQTLLSAGDASRSPTLGDFDGDGVLDIANLDATDNTVSIFIGNATSTSAADEIDISSQANAQNLLEILDTAIENLSANRAQLGAYQSRFESAINVALLMVENLSITRSTLIDADIAEETEELVKYQIMQQATVAVLGQANNQLQTVLRLIQF